MGLPERHPSFCQSKICVQVKDSYRGHCATCVDDSACLLESCLNDAAIVSYIFGEAQECPKWLFWKLHQYKQLPHPICQYCSCNDTERL